MLSEHQWIQLQLRHSVIRSVSRADDVYLRKASRAVLVERATRRTKLTAAQGKTHVLAILGWRIPSLFMEITTIKALFASTSRGVAG